MSAESGKMGEALLIRSKFHKWCRRLSGLVKSIYWSLRAWLANPQKSYLLFLKRQDKYFARLAASGMRWRGFAADAIHPKHLFDVKSHSILHPLFKPGIHYLDGGSGSGYECIKAMQGGAQRAVGIEYNPDNIALSQARAREAGLEVTILDLDLENGPYPFEDGTFDLINCSDVLEHLVNRTACLKELKRIKKPDAPIIISIPNADTPWKKRLRRAGVDSRDDNDHKIEYSRDGVFAEIAAAGLRIDGELHSIIPSFPWNGLIAFSAVLSPALYRRLQEWKYDHAKRYPERSIGWMFKVI